MEVWKDVVGYEGLYKVSNLGNVKSNKQTLKLHTDKGGYMVAYLSKNNKTKIKKVHRLVAEAFIPNRDCLPFVNHKDECKTNNNARNLEWCSSQYNNTYGSRIEKARKKQIKPVLQYSVTGDFIRAWESLTDASATLHIHNGSVSECCKGKRKTAGGYVWKYGGSDGIYG